MCVLSKWTTATLSCDDTGTAYREADEPAFVGAMSSANHRTDAGWKLALCQQTQISD
jgi:hypothetical protein